MAYPVIFSQLTGGVQPLTDFNIMFNVVGGMGTIFCTAAGANTIALSPTSNMPSVTSYSSYSSYQAFSFVAVASPTGPVTLNVSGVGALPAYASDGATQLDSGSLVVGVYYLFAYNVALNSGDGGFQILSNSGILSNTNSPGASTFKNLKGVWVSNATATFTADQIILQNSSFVSFLATSFSQTLNTATTGAGGLDTGSPAASTWYYVYAIYNGSLQDILISLSPTAPTLPSGYTYSARIGAIWLDGSVNIQGFIQYNRNTKWVVGSNLSGLPVMASGTAGSPTTPVYVSVATGAYVPATASQILIIANNSSTGVTLVAPNNNYGTDASNIPPFAAANSGTNQSTGWISLSLESANIYWANSSAAGQLAAYGYEDNL